MKTLSDKEVSVRIQAIFENWYSLSKGKWSEKSADNLLKRLSEVINAIQSDKEKTDIYQHFFRLREYLQSLLQKNTLPNAKEIGDVDQLLEQLKTTIHSLCAISKDQQLNITLYILSSRCSQFTEIIQRLKEASIKTLCFSDAQAMMFDATQNKPTGYIIDSNEQTQLQPYLDEFKKIETKFDTEPAKFFYCDTVSVETRLKAIRNGAKWVISSQTSIQQNVDKIIKNVKTILIDTEHQHKVMIVEDNLLEAQYVAKILSKANINGMMVTQPLEVIGCLEKFKPDLILMDIYMPDADGLELTSLIRDYKEFSHTPIVFLSGEEDPERQLEAISVGGDEFLTKPIRPKQLIKTITSRIQRYKKINESLGCPDTENTTGAIFNESEFLQKVTEGLKTSYIETTAIFYCQVVSQQAMIERYGLGGMDNLVDEIGKVIDEHLNGNEIVAKFKHHGLAVLARRESNNKLVKFAEHLKDLVEHTPFLVGNEQLNLMVSFGVCLFDENLDDAHGLTKRAESACRYIAAKGGDEVHIYSIADEEPKENTSIFVAKMREKIHTALAGNLFGIYYQPIINLKNKSQKNYAVQYHLFSEQGDLIPQDIILKAAGNSGNQPALDQLILDQSIETHNRQRKKNIGQLFIPQSIDSLLLEDGYSEDILNYLRRWNIEGHGIVLSFNYLDVRQEIKTIKTQFELLKEEDIQIMITDLALTENALKTVQYLNPEYIIPSKDILKIKPKSLPKYIKKIHHLGAQVLIQNINKPREFIYFWKSGADFLQGDFIQAPSERMNYDFQQNPANKIKPLVLHN